MKNKKHSLYLSFLVMTLIPIIGYSAIILIFSSTHIQELMNNHTKEEMTQSDFLIREIYDARYEGDIHYDVENDKLMKGENDISTDYSVLDGIKERFDMDASIIMADTRLLTTIRDEKGVRLVNSLVNARVVNDIKQKKKSIFYNNIDISGEKYLAYYSPIEDRDGNIIGMIAVLKNTSEIEAAVRKAIHPIVILTVCIMLIASAISIAFSKSIVDNIRRVESFMVKIAGGNLTCNQPDSDLKRNNELGEMARTAEEMQNALRVLVEIDELTGVMNRKAGSARVKKAFEKVKERDGIITIAIGDIDFFKKVNDTYGHETGDVVLRNVAQTIKEYTEGKGVPIRWGGEEFLIIFESMNKADTIEVLEKVRVKIKEKVFTVEDAEFSVTMTFGAKQADKSMTYAETIAKADELLYKGKAEGRDRVM